MGGQLAEPNPVADVNAFVVERYPDARVVCSATPEVKGNRELAVVTEPKSLEDVDLGVVRAAFGVAETGSVYLGDRELSVSALGCTHPRRPGRAQSDRGPGGH